MAAPWRAGGLWKRCDVLFGGQSEEHLGIFGAHPHVQRPKTGAAVDFCRGRRAFLEPIDVSELLPAVYAAKLSLKAPGPSGSGFATGPQRSSTAAEGGDSDPQVRALKSQ